MPDRYFTPEYKEECFQEWWNRGRPGYILLYNLVPEDEAGKKPSQATLADWIRDWKIRASSLDEQIQNELEARMVKEKVEMLARHADIGQHITDKALQYLNENEFPSAATALRALTEGIRIERESRGLPDALRKMLNAEDDDLMKEVQELMAKVDIPEDEEE